MNSRRRDVVGSWADKLSVSRFVAQRANRREHGRGKTRLSGRTGRGRLFAKVFNKSLESFIALNGIQKKKNNFVLKNDRMVS